MLERNVAPSHILLNYPVHPGSRQSQIDSLTSGTFSAIYFAVLGLFGRQEIISLSRLKIRLSLFLFAKVIASVLSDDLFLSYRIVSLLV